MNGEIYVVRELDKYSSVTDIILSKNYELENKILEKKVVEANYMISKQLDIPLASKLFALKRVRIVNGKAKSLERVYIGLDEIGDVADLDLNNTSLYKKMKEHLKIHSLRSQEEIMIVEANEEEKQLLELDGDEILLIRGVTYRDNDAPFEYFEIAAVPEFFRFKGMEVNE